MLSWGLEVFLKSVSGEGCSVCLADRNMGSLAQRHSQEIRHKACAGLYKKSAERFAPSIMPTPTPLLKTFTHGGAQNGLMGLVDKGRAMIGIAIEAHMRAGVIGTNIFAWGASASVALATVIAFTFRACFGRKIAKEIHLVAEGVEQCGVLRTEKLGQA